MASSSGLTFSGEDYARGVTFTPTGTITIPAYRTGVSIDFSFYCSGGQWGDFYYDITLYLSNGTSLTGTASAYQTSNRFTMSYSWSVNNVTSSAWTVTSIYVVKTSGPYSKVFSSDNNAISAGDGSVYRTAVSTPGTPTLSANNTTPSTSVTLSWSASSGGINTSVSKYQIYRDNSYFTETTGTSITVTSPSNNGGTYTYKVKAIANVSGYDSGFSGTVTLKTTWGGLSAPSNVRIDESYLPASTTTTLRWNAVSGATNNSVTGYTIFKGSTALGTVTTTSYTITSEQSGSATYYVRANGSIANSSNSSGVTLYTYTAPGAPTSVGLSATSVAPGSTVKLSWSGATDGTYNNITGYEVYRSSSATTNFTKVGNTLGTNVSSLDVSAPTTQGATYYFYVRVLGTRGGSSADSSTVSVTTYTYRPVSAPTQLSVSPTIVAAGGSATLSWNAGTGTEHVTVSSYQVYRSTSQNGVYTALGNNTTSRSMTVYAPSQGAYYYKVQSIGSVTGYDSELSSVIAVLTVNTAPSIPTGFSVTPVEYNAGNLDFTWNPSTDPEGDNIYYKITMNYNGIVTTIVQDLVDALYSADLSSQIARGTSATFYVYAYDSSGATSAASNSVTVTRVESVSASDLEIQNYTGNVCYSYYPVLMYKAKRKVKVTPPQNWVSSTNLYIEINDIVILTSNVKYEPRSSAVADRITQTIPITITDQYGNTATLNQQIIIAQPEYWDDPALIEEFVKAAHINNLREVVSTMYKFMTGQNFSGWSTGDVIAGVTSLGLWTQHIQEIRTAVEDIIVYLNNSVGSVYITSPNWEIINENKPRAWCLNQIWYFIRNGFVENRA